MDIRQLATNRPATVAVGPHNYAYLYQGYGLRPIRIDLKTGDTADSGIPEPTQPPQVTASGPIKYYVPRVDVEDAGQQYLSPPTVTFTGTAERPAVARAFLENDGLNSVQMLDYGRGYTSPPQAVVGNTSGSGAIFEVILANGATTRASGVLETVSLISQPSFSAGLPPVNSDGVAFVSGVANPAWSFTDPGGNVYKAARRIGNLVVYSLELTGGAKVEITFNSITYSNATTTIWFPTNVNMQFGGVRLLNGGAGYSDSSPYVVRIPSYPRSASGLPDTQRPGVSGTTAFACEFYTGANPNSPANQYSTGAKFPIKEVRVISGGSGYTGAPKLKITEAQP